MPGVAQEGEEELRFFRVFAAALRPPKYPLIYPNSLQAEPEISSPIPQKVSKNKESV